ncbi:hypothetical protein IGI04_002275 [Brassica rapa subsp. trilocularis]|uniref:LOB domain-containing protein n=1 Tax=Brassica rapa subsp. trilocularis TaxID=1813537 RepID=A0ABQ7NV32_BRACM|nr:hypothetical protein IGI04_002275 [Brassica rapa subsp. trilocularis]
MLGTRKSRMHVLTVLTLIQCNYVDVLHMILRRMKIMGTEVNEILSPEAAEAAYRNGRWTNQIQMFAKNGCSNASPLFSSFAQLASGLIASSACELLMIAILEPKREQNMKNKHYEKTKRCIRGLELLRQEHSQCISMTELQLDHNAATTTISNVNPGDHALGVSSVPPLSLGTQREVRNSAYSSSSATLTLCVGRFIEPVTYVIPRRYERTSDVQFEVEECIDVGAVTRE